MLSFIKNLFKKKEPVKADEKPYVEMTFTDGKFHVKSYNQAFIDDLRGSFGILSEGKTDTELVELFLEKKNVEHEPPKLDVKHFGLTDDGFVKMELDWNRSFILHLKKHGIEAETEEEAVELYLSMLSKKAGRDSLGQELLEEGFSEIDEEVQREYDEAARQLQDQMNRERTEAVLKEKRKAKRQVRKTKEAAK